MTLSALTTKADALQVISFCEGWEFKKGPIPTEPVKAVATWGDKWKAVEIPHTWNATDMQTKYNDFYAGPCYYRKTYHCPANLRDKRVFLRFEGVGACADVYINH